MKTPRVLHAFSLTFIPAIFAVMLLMLAAPDASYSQSYHRPRHYRSFSQSGVFFHAEVTQAFGLNSTSAPYSDRFFGAATVAGYQFSSTLFAGLGAGILDYNAGVMAPVFLHGRFCFTEIKNNPFIGADAGVLLRVSGEETDNLFFTNPSAGISFQVADYTTLIFSLGLFSQWQKGGGRDSFINLKLGLSFF